MGMFLVLPNFDFAPFTPLLHQLGQSLTLGRTNEFTHIARDFAFFALTLVSLDMIRTLLSLYPLDINSPCLDSLLNF